MSARKRRSLMHGISSALAAAPLALVPHFTAAHHSGAKYDQSARVTIAGTVTHYEWRNPHVYIYVEEAAGSGRREWEVEGMPTTVMQRLGWSAATLRRGDRVEVSGHPARNPADTSLFPTSVVMDQRVLYEQVDSLKRLSSAGGAPTTKARSLEGTWETLLNLDLVMALFVPRVELTAEGHAAVAAFDDRTMNPAADCTPNAAPLLMMDPDVKRIEVRDDLIVIAGASGMAERRVHMNATSHEAARPSVQGHSVGRWEGDTLVIETRGFSDHRMGNGYAGIPSGPQKHLVERLTLDVAGGTLLYRFELKDPQFLAQPVTGEVTWAFRPDLTVSAAECSLDNARRFRH